MWNEVQRLYTEGTAAEIATAGLAVSGIAVVAFIWRWGKRRSSVRLTDETRKLLEEAPSDPAPGCVAILDALNSAAVTDDEAECAEQMRQIVASGVLPYRSLAEDPELLLKCSPFMRGAAPGALWTRFTVSYNLYAGSIVALGSDEQRDALCAAQPNGQLGCFAFTELGAGVLSGAGVETTATYDAGTDEFVIHSPTPSSKKTWISQGLYSEHAVILAELIISGESKGPHLFWAKIAEPAPATAKNKPTTRPVAVPGVCVTSLPGKIALKGLDNAYIQFDSFRVARSGLLSRFCEVAAGGGYTLKLPTGTKRMLDLLISRLLTGRIVLSEATVGYARALVRRSWTHCVDRELWRGRKDVGPKMSTMPLIRGCFKEYAECLAIVAAFIADTRTQVATAISTDTFSNELIEATCMCKFVGTGFAVDTVSTMRKLMGSRALQADAWLGDNSFVCNATCAAEGDNTVMELKIVQDMVRGRTKMFPAGLLARLCGTAAGRSAVATYLKLMLRVTILGKDAITEGQLLRDIAWARLHLRVIDVWTSRPGVSAEQLDWLASYAKVMMVFPTPVTM